MTFSNQICLTDYNAHFRDCACVLDSGRFLGLSKKYTDIFCTCVLVFDNQIGQGRHENSRMQG